VRRKEGHVYLRGKVWWIKYSQNGRVAYESSKSRNKKDADDLLKIRLSEIVYGHPVVASRHILFSELIDDLMLDYINNNRKNTVNLAWKIKKHVLPYFGNKVAVDITSADIAKYIGKRLDTASNATINRELAAIRRTFSIAKLYGKIQSAPNVQLLKENPPRSGFFELKEVKKLLKHLPKYLHGVVWFAYYTGWRKSEIINLKWEFVDLRAGEIRIPPGGSKNDEPRIFPMTKPLKELLKKQPRGEYVFTRDGQRIIDFRTAWENAVGKAKLTNRVFHDFRRTAARNMSRAGIPERVAMQMMGQKTRHIYDRYRIVSESDLKEARDKLNRLNPRR
jgi:integrase